MRAFQATCKIFEQTMGALGIGRRLGLFHRSLHGGAHPVW